MAQVREAELLSMITRFHFNIGLQKEEGEEQQVIGEVACENGKMCSSYLVLTSKEAEDVADPGYYFQFFLPLPHIVSLPPFHFTPPISYLPQSLWLTLPSQPIREVIPSWADQRLRIADSLAWN